MGLELICSIPFRNHHHVCICYFLWATDQFQSLYFHFCRSQEVGSRSTIFALILIEKLSRNTSYNLFCFLFIFFFCAGGKTPDVGSRTYAHIIREQQLRAEEQQVTLTRILVS